MMYDFTIVTTSMKISPLITMDNYDNNGYTKLTMMTHYTFISIYHGYFMDHSP